MAEARQSRDEAKYKADLEKLKNEHVIRAKIRQRGTKRGQITKLLTKLEGDMPVSIYDTKCAVSKLKGMHDTLKLLDSEVDSFMVASDIWTDDEYSTECESIEYYQDVANNMIIKLECHLESLEQAPPIANNQQPSNSSNFNTGVNTSKLKLPHIELPSFDGTPELYEQFIVNFEQSIQNFSLSEYEKFSLLLKQVSGPARTMVDSVKPGEQTYAAAKALLNSAFSDITCQQFSVIKKIINLSFSSMENYYEWICEARTLKSQVERLNIDGDVFMQFYLWNSLPMYVRSQFSNINNTAKPTTDVILDSAFEVFNRLRDVPSVHSHGSDVSHLKPRDTIALATGYNKASGNKDSKVSNIVKCVLCEYENKSSNHKIHECPNFDTPERKLMVIERANGCTKCGKLNHNISDCRFRFFSRCGNCGKFHAFFLCTDKGSRSNSKYSKEKASNDKNGNNFKRKPNKATASAANVVQYNVMLATSNDNIIVPSFTAKIGNKNNIRCMYDPAAQTTFISEKAFKKINCRVINNNIKINVSGFNSSKIMSTKLVEMKVKLNNKKEHWNIHAIVVPELRSKINVSLDDVIEKFKEINIPLADRLLCTKLPNDIDILFGVDNVHILPVHACSFGGNKLSTVYYTCQGIMLAGNVADLRENLKYIDSVGKFVADFDRFFR